MTQAASDSSHLHDALRQLVLLVQVAVQGLDAEPSQLPRRVVGLLIMESNKDDESDGMGWDGAWMDLPLLQGFLTWLSMIISAASSATRLLFSPDARTALK